jgi:hypothetical protein
MEVLDGGLTWLERWQVSADEGVAQQVADGGKKVGLGGAGGVPGKGN